MRNPFFLFVVMVIAWPLGSIAQRADSLHQASIVIDTHNDVLISSIMEGKNIANHVPSGHTDIPRFFEGGVNAQIFSVWCGGDYGKGRAYNFANQQIDALTKIVAENPDKLQLATTKEDVLSAAKENKLAVLMGVEGGHMIEDDLSYLQNLYDRGVRYLTLTWNNSTDWASSASDETNPKSKIKHKGLTDFGREVVRYMNKIGMMVDLSHVGEQTFYDAIETTSKPVIVSHSNVYAIAPVPRNLKDEQIKAIAENDGVICINFYSGFLEEGYNRKVDSLYAVTVPEKEQKKNVKGDGKFDKLSAEAKEQVRPELSVVIDHIDYIVNLVGIDYVGLGGDFDGVESTAKGLDDVSAYPNITKALVERGYSDGDIQKILGLNVLRVLDAQ
ncbi:dipeptidase [Albibacterium indicum]|uniref:dipeptidase n=1 Tax=Albibacterium indicum TaxID=2292082 RepID=UPI001FE88724|nr:dipeptidase [Pedobacter indicus]